MSEYLRAAGSWKLEAESKSLEVGAGVLGFKLQASGFKLPAASKTIYPSVEPEA
jgi:hypothetical protein